jgi:hypothetical protein
MPDAATPAAPAAPAPAPATPSAPASPESVHVSGGIAPSAQESLLGQPAASPAEGGFKYVGDDGNFVKDWSTHLPEDMGDFRTKLAGYKNPVEVAKALHNANQALSKKGVIVPTPQSTPEEVASFRKALGVPDTPKAYLEKAPKDIPPGVSFDEATAMSYMEVAHRFNVPADAMAALMAVNAKQAELQVKADQQRTSEIRHQGQQQLRKVWGRDYERNMELASRAVRYTGVNPNSYGFRDPEIVRAFTALAKEISEDRIIGATGALPAGIHEMKANALDIMRNPQNKDFQKYRDGDPDVRSRVRRMLTEAESGNGRR